MLEKYLNFRFIHNNVKRYWKYVNEWIEGLNESQLAYFEKEMFNLIKEGTYDPER
jgi:hypothetical protein